MPAPYLGEILTARVRATDPVTRSIITDAAGTAYFFAPPKNPQANPADRTPDLTLSLTYDSSSRYYLASFSTTGAPWVAGVWWWRPVIAGGSGGYDAWDYFSFTLSA